MTEESPSSQGPAGPSRGTSPDEGPPASSYAGAGFQFALALLLFFFAGRWLDGKLGTGPWLMLLGMVVGGSAGFYSMYSKLMAANAREEQAMRERRERRERERGGRS